jgi:hypothetical protein
MALAPDCGCCCLAAGAVAAAAVAAAAVAPVEGGAVAERETVGSVFFEGGAVAPDLALSFLRRKRFKSGMMAAMKQQTEKERWKE